MKRTVGVVSFFLALLIVCSGAGIVSATPLLDVYLPDRTAHENLQAGGFDVVSIERQRAEVVGWPGDIQRLGQYGLTYNVMIEDIESFYRDRLDFELDDMGGYPTFDEICEWMEDFIADHPDIVSDPVTVGYSLEDRPLIAFKISDNPNEDEDEPEVFINATIHAREVIVPLVIMHFSELLADGYGTDPRITEIVNNREVWILPVVNPDGYTYNEETNPNGGGMWRKNKRYVDNVLYGVDLNRNWSYNWGYDDSGSSPLPWSQTYRGASPASEPETQVVVDFVNSHEFMSCINYHSYGEYIIYPYGYNIVQYPEHIDIYQQITDAMNVTLGWETGSAPVVLYSVNGDACDWMEGGADNRLFAFVFEVGTNFDGFWPPTYRIDTLVEEQEEPLLTFCEIGGEPFQLAPPVPPVVTAPDTVYADFTITWIPSEDPWGNDPVAYDVIEYTDPTDSDDAEEELGTWDYDGFERSSLRYHSDGHSYFSGTGNLLYNTQTAAHEYIVQTGDDFSFYCWYDMEVDWDYIYIQISVDGESYVNLPGNLTTNTDPHERNLGNGITGNSGGWVEGVFPLDDYSGQSVRLRFTHITDAYVNEEGFYADDITPVTAFTAGEMIAADIVGTVLEVEYPDLQVPETRYYSVRSIDVQDQQSFWSVPEAVYYDLPSTDLAIIATPHDPPVYIQTWGGNFQWDVEIENLSGDTYTYDAWTEVILPNGNTYGPLSLYQNLTLLSGQTLTASPVQYVPAMAPNGWYTYLAKVGDYPDAIAMDGFEFGKLPLQTQADVAYDQVEGWFLTGWIEGSQVAEEGSGLAVPLGFTVGNAYPNPFNPSTTISVGLPQRSSMKVCVYNLMGREVAVLASGSFTQGYHHFTFDARNHSSGLYFLRVMVPGELDVMRKIVLVK